MLKFHLIIIKFSIFINQNSQSDTFFPKLKNTVVKIDIKSFSVWFQTLKNLFLKIENGEVVGNLFSEKMIHNLLESHNILKFGKKQ